VPRCGASEPESILKVKKGFAPMAGCGTIFVYIVLLVISGFLSGLVGQISTVLGVVVLFLALISGIVFCLKV